MNGTLAWGPARLPLAIMSGPSDLPGHAVDPTGRAAVHWTSTARSALRPILLYLRGTGALPDVNAEMLMPQWACSGLYNTTQKICFPTIQDTPSLRGVMVYHQYGFPQRLDDIAQRCRERGLFLIENCVNCAFDGPSSRGVGATGIAGIFSLPKMYGTLLGGALSVRDAGLEAFCSEYFQDRDEPWIGRLSSGARWLAESLPGSRSQRFQEMAYALSDYGRRIHPQDLSRLRRDLAAGAISARKRNYAQLLKEFPDAPFFQGLEGDVTPYLVPLFGPIEFLKRLAARLTSRGWESGVNHFDAARNVFEPRFVPCVPLPVHQSLGEREMGALMDDIRAEGRSYNERG